MTARKIGAIIITIIVLGLAFVYGEFDSAPARNTVSSGSRNNDFRLGK